MPTFTPKIEAFKGARLTFHSNNDFDDVFSKLYSSIGTPDKVDAWPRIAKAITLHSTESRDQLIDSVKATTGPHDFMIFQDLNHGAWIPLFDVGNGLKVKRIILGNPLVAITMLKRDLTAGLAVPVELLVLQKDEGTDVIYQLPSALISGINNDAELLEAAKVLDAKLEILADE